MTRILKRLEDAKIMRTHSSGLLRIRSLSTGITRRDFGRGALGLTAGTAMTLYGVRPAAAGTQVNYMGWQGFEDPFNADEFASKHDIDLNITYQNDNSHAIAVATGGGIGNMDIVTPDYAYTPLMKEIGMLQPIDMDLVPNFEGLFDRFRNLDGPKVDGKQYSLPLSWGSIPLMYNTDHVTETPSSWLDLLKPEYKGRVALTNDVFSVMVAFALAATGTKTPTLTCIRESGPPSMG